MLNLFFIPLSTEFVQMMTAKWTGLPLTKNQSNVSLTSYCKNLHLLMLFCIDNLNWMLENWKSVRINKFKKAKKGKKNLKSICMYWLVFPAPPPSAKLPNQISTSLANQLLCSCLVWPLLICFLVPSAWCHDDYAGWPIAFPLQLPVFLFSCSSCMQL